MIKVYGYSKCSTCKKAEAFLKKRGLTYKFIDIVEHPPKQSEIKKFHKNAGIEIKKIFNTSGKMYRELNIKDKLSNLGDQDIYSMLSQNGMLIKRPIIVKDDFVQFGFREEPDFL